MKRFLEAGRLNSPRGLNGEVRFECWCDSIGFLENVRFLYLDAEGRRPIEVKAFNTRLSTVIFRGYEDRTKASGLTGRTVWFDREDIVLPEGVCYNDDLIGLPVYNESDGKKLGVLTRIDEGEASDLYYISGETDYIIPAVKEFIVKKDLEKGITVRLIDGFQA